MSNIEIQGCHHFDEKDEKLEKLDFGGDSGSELKTSAVDMTPRPPIGRAPLKKRLPHPPCGHTVTALPLTTGETPQTDTVIMYQSVGFEPEPNH